MYGVDGGARHLRRLPVLVLKVEAAREGTIVRTSYRCYVIVPVPGEGLWHSVSGIPTEVEPGMSDRIAR
jgi:hypothetical protein